MGSVFETMAAGAPAVIGMVAAILFVGAAYLITTIDRHRADSPTKGDTQVGLKLVLFALILAGIQLAAMGAIQFLAFAFGGFKGGSLPVRAAIPPIIVGAVIVASIVKALLPRTNWMAYQQPERYLLGALALQFGVMTILAVSGLLTGLFLEMSWSSTSSSLASTIVNGGVAYLALMRLGAASGWVQPPPRPVALPPPPQGGGFPPPQGGGFPPPQGGGFPPPQGGGGFPPPQGGGGFPPPQGGGGFPPPQGGGYPPQ